MKIGKLRQQNNQWICSECRMRQNEPFLKCKFCEAIMSNYEDVIIEREKYELENLVNSQARRLLGK